MKRFISPIEFLRELSGSATLRSKLAVATVVVLGVPAASLLTLGVPPIIVAVPIMLAIPVFQYGAYWVASAHRETEVELVYGRHRTSDLRRIVRSREATIEGADLWQEFVTSRPSQDVKLPQRWQTV